MKRVRVAVLASGWGSNLQVLLDRCAARDAPAEVVAVFSDRPGAAALERARGAGIAGGVIPDPADGGALNRQLEGAGADLVVLAGYLKLVPAATVRRFAGRMLNIHPALLPSFGGHGMYGHHVHRAVLASGARVTGCTVHLVDEAYDRGPILAQWPVPVLSGDSPETLAARVLGVEHQLLTAVVFAAARAIATGGSITPLTAAGDGFTAAAVPAVDFR